MVKKVKTLTVLSLLSVLLLVLGACSNGNEEKNSNNEDMDNMEEMDNMDHDNMEMDEEGKETGNSSGMKEMFAKAPEAFNNNAATNLLTQNTKNVTRIPTDDPIEASIYISQTIWPSTHKENQPGTVILAPLDSWQISLAGADLIHHPNNGPILFTNKESISSNVLNEIKRLNPIGNSNGTQVMIMGEVSDSVKGQLSDYKMEQIKGENPAAFAKNIDEAYAKVSGGYPDSVIIASSEEKNKHYSIPAVNWIAHMPEPLLYVSDSGIPKETQDALKERNNKANIYILGPESVISKEMEDQLKDYGNVKRIGAKDPVSTSIEFAKFKDKDTKFGWGLTEPGHGVSFVSTETPEVAIAAAPFSHMGKHAPVIWLNKGGLQKETYDFLASIKPTFKDDPTTGPYNHSFLVGTAKQIPYKTQGIIDDKLEIVQENGEGHGGH